MLKTALCFVYSSECIKYLASMNHVRTMFTLNRNIQLSCSWSRNPPLSKTTQLHGISAKKYCFRNPTVPLGGQYFPFYFPPFLGIHLADLFQECMGKASQLKMRKTISCRSRFNFNYKAISNLYGHNRKTEFVKLASPWIHNLSSSFSLQDKTLRILLQQTF